MFFKEFLLLRQPGRWVVHTADHFAPALACIKQHPIDLAVLDLRMPVMDGMQLLKLFKRTHPEIQVIILTSAATEESRNQCLESGAILFFDKTEVSDNLDKIYVALESVASSPTEGFRGVLRQVGLTDVLQMECLGRKSSVLEIQTQNQTGRIFISAGDIVHAELGELRGERALFGILGLRGGEFHLRPFARPQRQTIDGHWESLVMEAARLQDEASAGTEGSAAAASPEASEPGEIESASPREIVEIVLCSPTGELLYDWESKKVDGRLALLSQFAQLSEVVGRTLDWGQGLRLDARAGEHRAIALLQPDRRLLIRSTSSEDGGL